MYNYEDLAQLINKIGTVCCEPRGVVVSGERQ